MISSSGSRGTTFRVALSFALGLVVLLSLGMAPGADANLTRTDSWGGNWRLPHYSPAAVAFSPTGAATVADQGIRRVIELDPDGHIDSIWFPECDGDDDCQVSDIAIDGSGNRLVLLRGFPDRIVKYSPAGELIGEIYSTLDNIPEIAYDPSGVVFFLEKNVETTKVKSIETDGTAVSSWNVHSSVDVTTMALDGDGHVLIAGTSHQGTAASATKSIYRFDFDGNRLSTWTEPGKMWFIPVVHHGETGYEIGGVRGYEGITPRADGGLWVTHEDSPAQLNGISPAGEPDGARGPAGQSGGRLETDPDGDLWVTNWQNLFQFDPAGGLRRVFRGSDFPKYGQDRGEGLFGWDISDIEAGPDGSIYVWDSPSGRGQRFSPSGDFLSLWDGPENYRWWEHELAVRPDGGTMILDRGNSELSSYADTGVEISRSELSLDARQVQDVAMGAEGPLLLSGPPATVQRLYGDDQGPWVANDVETPPFDFDHFPLELREMPGGDILIASSQKIHQFTAEGTPIRSWDVSPRWCSPGRRSLYDLGLDSAGNIFVFSRGEAIQSVTKYSPTGEELWEERVQVRISEYYEGDHSYENMAVAPAGDLYLSDGYEIDRFEQPDPGAARPAEECEPPGPVGRPFGVRGVEYAKGRHMAKVRLWAPGPGRVAVRGNKRIRGAVKRVRAKGMVTVPVRLKAAVRRKKGPRRLELRVKFTFRGEGGNQTASAKLKLRR